MRWRWVLALVPAIAGAAISAWFNGTNRAPLFRVTIDLGTVLFALGILLSSVIAALLYCQASTERARRETVAAASQDRRRFLRRLDHELKNPLTAILAGLANVSVGDGDAAQRLALDSVTVQVNRLRALVAELRKLSDLETRELEREPVDVTELLEEVFALAQDRPCAPELPLFVGQPVTTATIA